MTTTLRGHCYLRSRFHNFRVHRVHRVHRVRREAPQALAALEGLVAAGKWEAAPEGETEDSVVHQKCKRYWNSIERESSHSEVPLPEW